MTNIIKQLKVENKTVLFFEDPLPLAPFNTVVIEGAKYKTIPVFGMDKCLAIEADGQFTNKPVVFIYEVSA